jgi:hypothetical protein
MTIWTNRANSEVGLANAKKICATLGLSVCTVAIWYQDGHAYVDPSTGSYMFQLVIGSVFGGILAVRVCWKNVRSFLTMRPVSQRASSTDVKSLD